MKVIDNDKLTNLICKIVGDEKCREDVKNLLDLVLGEPPSVKEQVAVDDNQIKEEENLVDLQDALNWKLPNEFNLQIQGEDGLRKIKILPDGMTENPVTEEEKKTLPS
jgi:hypothetical protein